VDLATLVVWMFLLCAGIFLSFMGLMILAASVIRISQVTARMVSNLSNRRSS
jgi:hypothetical protein